MSSFMSGVGRCQRRMLFFVSEYDMPDDFVCIWKGEHETILKVKEHEKRIEKLFVLR